MTSVAIIGAGPRLGQGIRINAVGHTLVVDGGQTVG